jgi:hypothetical protein
MLKQLEAKYPLFDSIEAMLTLDSMSKILQSNIAHVTCQPFEDAGGVSGSHLYKVIADNQTLIMKHMKQSSDWMALALNDTRCRSVSVWQNGLLDQLRPTIDHAILAACENGDDYALLMHDVSSGMTPYGQKLPIKTVYAMLSGLAAMHAQFWEDESLKRPELGLCNIEILVTGWWLKQCYRYPHATEWVDLVSKGWDALLDMIEPDVRVAIQSILDKPQILFERLATYPATLVHGDFRPANLACLPDTNQLVAFDWQVVSYAPAVIDLCWFLNSSAIRETQYSDTQYYKEQLATRLGKRFNRDSWQSMYEVGCLVDVLRRGHWHALEVVGAEDEIQKKFWRKVVADFNDIVRQGVRWL